MDRTFEYEKADDKFFDYCHYEYKPDTDFANKLRSVNLLMNSFNFMKCKKYFHELVGVIRKNIGLKNTVWGFKKAGNNFGWEFYFYNYQKKDPKINIANVQKVIIPFFDLKITPNENIPYFMFSIDVLQSFFDDNKLNGVHVYIGGRSNYGFSYFWDENGITKENIYSFFDAKKEKEKITKELQKSIFVDFSKIKISEVLIPELQDCKSICVAKKQTGDSIYFSGINIGQFLFFLKRFEYPDEIISFIEQNKLKLDHLQYDVGFDYRMESGKLKILKSGYYGTF